MTNSFTSDELQALAVFPFKDPQWKTKFLLGFLLILASYVIPVLPMVIVYGYCAQIMRRIIVKQGEPFLPDWDDWGELFTIGLKLLGVSVVYSLPFLLIFCSGYGLFFTTTMWPQVISHELDANSPLIWVPSLIGMIGWAGSFAFGMILLLAVGIILPVAIGHVIATNEFAAAFRVSEWWAIFRANLAGYLITYVLIFGFWVVISFALQFLYLTIIFCCLVPFVTPFLMIYMMVISSVLFAQAYRTGVDMSNSQSNLPQAQ